MSPCVADKALDTTTGISMCEKITACNADKLTYFENVFTTKGLNSLNPVGIAKDGFIIYGPYNAAG